MTPKLQDTAETIIKFIAKYPPLTLMGRAAETAKCVYCQAFGATKTITHRDDCIHLQAKAWAKAVKEQERTNQATEG
jgi:hypothetical protein